MAGRHDWLFPPEFCAPLVRSIANAKLVVLEESSHMPFVEEREAFVREMTAFLS